MFGVVHIQNVIIIKFLGGVFFIWYVSLISLGHWLSPLWLFTCSHPLNKFWVIDVLRNLKLKVP